MKSALNGVPSLSVLDGWWVEGHIDGVTGWSIGGGRRGELEKAAIGQKMPHLFMTNWSISFFLSSIMTARSFY